jgi:hypothetical protein
MLVARREGKWNVVPGYCILIGDIVHRHRVVS